MKPFDYNECPYLAECGRVYTDFDGSTAVVTYYCHDEESMSVMEQLQAIERYRGCPCLDIWCEATPGFPKRCANAYATIEGITPPGRRD